ncbi:MAG: hypothetical protein KAI47_22795, partial [Deltaproteobacteria bacterium]|nr:hypothetical protein [Deltaproteobacteria bacterium]
DTAIAAGKPGACPTSCNDGKVCTKDKLQNGGTCTAECVFTSITICVNSDGCCPAACNANNDNDCSPVCGNGVVESGEICDKGISAGNPGACPTSCAAKTCKKWALTGLTASCSRTCTYSNDDNATCSGGTCHGGSCCQGCWNGSCQVGTSLTVCGHAGGSCASCSDSNACTDDSCASGTCKNTNDDTNTCSGGTCHGGSCCTGCWNGTSCQVGTSLTACGGAGASCDNCDVPVAPCQEHYCSVSKTPTCATRNIADNTSCSSGSGRCHSGSCCTGCWDPTHAICESGLEQFACGNGGNTCDVCSSGECCNNNHFCWPTYKGDCGPM